VTENRGKRTPGVDGRIWSTPAAKSKAVQSLRHRGYRPQPLRRIYIPKSNGKQRRTGAHDPLRSVDFINCRAQLFDCAIPTTRGSPIRGSAISDQLHARSLKAVNDHGRLTSLLRWRSPPTDQVVSCKPCTNRGSRCLLPGLVSVIKSGQIAVIVHMLCGITSSNSCPGPCLEQSGDRSSDRSVIHISRAPAGRFTFRRPGRSDRQVWPKACRGPCKPRQPPVAHYP